MPNQSLTDKLNAAIGSQPIDAIAIGNVDTNALDEVVFSRAGTLSILMNTANGFKAPDACVAIPEQSPIAAIAIGDVDRNGKNDIAVAHSSAQAVNVFLNNN